MQKTIPPLDETKKYLALSTLDVRDKQVHPSLTLTNWTGCGCGCSCDFRSREFPGCSGVSWLSCCSCWRVAAAVAVAALLDSSDPRSMPLLLLLLLQSLLLPPSSSTLLLRPPSPGPPPPPGEKGSCLMVIVSPEPWNFKLGVIILAFFIPLLLILYQVQLVQVCGGSL